MDDPLLSTGAPDFTDPLGLLGACHQRILGHCDLLERMLDWLPAHGADDEIRNAAQRVIRYFEVAAPHHHADEEHDLFPLLARSAALTAVLDRLRAEHTRLDTAWHDLEARLQPLLTGRIPADLASAVRAFNAAHRAHIETENREVLPAAAQLLDAAQIRLLGASMAARRGINAAVADRSNA